jgi:hypothetical protein
LFSNPDLLKQLREAENSGRLLQLLSSREH